MKVSKLMATDVITCRTDDTLDGAAELMWMHDVGSLPVVDEHGRVVGMLTDRDALMAAFTSKDRLRAISVGSTMSTYPFTCSQDDDVAAVEAEMGRRQIRRVPVVDDDDRPVGLLSMNDLVRASQRTTEVSPSHVTATLAAVCAPCRIGVSP